MSGENEEYKNKAREQSRMEGQQKQVKVKSYPEGTALAHLLLDLEVTPDENVLLKLQEIDYKAI
jgi:hypothetical protein